MEIGRKVSYIGEYKRLFKYIYTTLGEPKNNFDLLAVVVFH